MVIQNSEKNNRLHKILFTILKRHNDIITFLLKSCKKSDVIDMGLRAKAGRLKNRRDFPQFENIKKVLCCDFYTTVFITIFQIELYRFHVIFWKEKESLLLIYDFLTATRQMSIIKYTPPQRFFEKCSAEFLLNS